jgi:hypothetical protein
MKGRLGLLIGFGAGYVLGSKAGRDRYEQLRRLYDNVQASPAFKKATGKAKDAASSGLGSARDKASESAHKVVGAVKEHRAADAGPGLSVAPPPH